MKVTKKEITTLTADEGYVLTQSAEQVTERRYGLSVTLADSESQDDWKEIPIEDVPEGAEDLAHATESESLSDTDALNLILNGISQ